MATEKLIVTGMKCPKCEARAVKACMALEGVESATANHETNTVELTYSGDAAVLEAAKAAIVNAGYSVEG